MLLLHNNSLGDIIDTEKEKTKQEKKKKTRRFLHDLEHIPSLWFLLCWFKDFAKKNLVFFS